MDIQAIFYEDADQMLNKILYVTSFNKQLFKLAGHKLVQSFFNANIIGRLLITFEDNLEERLVNLSKEYLVGDRILLYDLNKDEWLHQWLKENEDIIPEEMGGRSKPCKCKLGADIWRTCDHVMGCHRTYFNYRASQWFRKIVALNYAINNYQQKIIIFVDADSIFRLTIHPKFIEEIFDKHGVFYHLGEIRRQNDMGVESGFIGFHKDYGGFDFLNKVIEIFKTGQFRKYLRWDDGYIFKKVIEEYPEFLTKDLTIGQTNQRACIKFGPFKDYFLHQKGLYKEQILDKYK